ncbi:MAG: tRNA (adenosine(37)-N6)-threonylcarbamoyltransferase complex ATPase subunit type 1 TsaE, partial [Coriobacteriales bacterium]
MQVVTHGVEQTVSMGRVLGQLVQAGSCIVLDGDLGAGKTQLTKGIASGLGVGDLVTSPTFTIMNEYLSGRLPLCHLDLYRLDTVEQLADIGFDDLFDGSSVVVIEWGERFPEMLPDDVLRLTFSLASSVDRVVDCT